MKHILVVCTANICRSPMAEALLFQALVDGGLADQVRVQSAGAYAVPGAAVSRGGTQAMAARGLDLSAHRSRPLDNALVQQADIILVMEEEHRRFIFHTWPQALRKTFLLSEMSGGHAGVADPFGQELPAYVATATEIADYVQKGLAGILRRLGINEQPSAPSS